MYKAYLVDDEEIILEELIQRIPWLDNGFEVIGYNTDPKKAISEIKGLEPDVVFCDLKILDMDGNELIRTLKSEMVSCEYVMISAYDDFESVRSFFMQSGFDYILKPVQSEDMQLVLERLVLKLREKENVREMEAAPTDHLYFNEMLTYIDDNFSKKITLEQLAKQFNFSKNYICNLFSKYYRSSLTRYLTEKRMLHAKKLLEDPSRLLKDIAIECGYSGYVHFYKVFKEYYGISPKEMQGKANEKYAGK